MGRNTHRDAGRDCSRRDNAASITTYEKKCELWRYVVITLTNSRGPNKYRRHIVLMNRRTHGTFNMMELHVSGKLLQGPIWLVSMDEYG